MSNPKEKPILFIGAMVRAILEGRKSQTRRVMKPQPTQHPTEALPRWKGKEVEVTGTYRCPIGKPGDRLWVRETYRTHYCVGTDREHVFYAADGMFENSCPHCGESYERWKPSIFCRRAASRIWLEIAEVRVERLQSISEEDAAAEGSMFWWNELSREEQAKIYNGGIGPKAAYQMLWESINGAESWKENPWVWVVEFQRVLTTK